MRGTAVPANQVLSPTRDRTIPQPRFMESFDVRAVCIVTVSRCVSLPLLHWQDQLGRRRGLGRGGVFGIWLLELLWDLELGIWSFPPIGSWRGGFPAYSKLSASSPRRLPIMNPTGNRTKHFASVGERWVGLEARNIIYLTQHFKEQFVSKSVGCRLYSLAEFVGLGVKP